MHKKEEFRFRNEQNLNYTGKATKKNCYIMQWFKIYMRQQMQECIAGKCSNAKRHEKLQQILIVILVHAGNHSNGKQSTQTGNQNGNSSIYPHWKHRVHCQHTSNRFLARSIAIDNWRQLIDLNLGSRELIKTYPAHDRRSHRWDCLRNDYHAQRVRQNRWVLARYLCSQHVPMTIQPLVDITKSDKLPPGLWSLAANYS